MLTARQIVCLSRPRLTSRARWLAPWASVCRQMPSQWRCTRKASTSSPKPRPQHEDLGCELRASCWQATMGSGGGVRGRRARHHRKTRPHRKIWAVSSEQVAGWISLRVSTMAWAERRAQGTPAGRELPRGRSRSLPLPSLCEQICAETGRSALEVSLTSASCGLRRSTSHGWPWS